jgi:hypothetical protein
LVPLGTKWERRQGARSEVAGRMVGRHGALEQRFEVSPPDAFLKTREDL